jgi:hypothetical protein
LAVSTVVLRLMAHCSFADACALVESALDARTRLVDDLSRSKPLGHALNRLRDHMRANSFDAFLPQYDHRTRQEGFHALHDWDGRAEQVLGDTIPVDVLDYVLRQRAQVDTNPRTIAVLLDYYYVHVLSLLALRVWDEGDADANLDRVGALLARLQGEGGSGQPLVADAETLILVATSHYEAVERGYDRLLRRVRTLSPAHQLRVALGHASSMGCHLRFGFEATYRRDTVSMREDNVADYPWLCYALVTLMREYVSSPNRSPASGSPVIEAMVNGLSADARAFVGAPPALLAGAEAERAEFRDAFLAYRGDLIAAFERYRPVDGRYTPLSFFFNFSHNVLKGTVADAAARGEPWPVSFNDLLTTPNAPSSAGETEVSEVDQAQPMMIQERLARTLMEYARANPDRINGEPTAVIAYDPRAGHRAFRIMMEKLSEERRLPSPS